MNFQITLKGYDGSTDRTDDLIKWAVAPDRETLDAWLPASGWEVEQLEAFHLGSPDMQPGDGVDVILLNGQPHYVTHYVTSQVESSAQEDRQALIDRYVDLMVRTRLYDAENSTSYEEEFAHCYRYGCPDPSDMSDASLRAEIEACQESLEP